MAYCVPFVGQVTEEILKSSFVITEGFADASHTIASLFKNVHLVVA